MIWLSELSQHLLCRLKELGYRTTEIHCCAVQVGIFLKGNIYIFSRFCAVLPVFPFYCFIKTWISFGRAFLIAYLRTSRFSNSYLSHKSDVRIFSTSVYATYFSITFVFMLSKARASENTFMICIIFH